MTFFVYLFKKTRLYIYSKFCIVAPRTALHKQVILRLTKAHCSEFPTFEKNASWIWKLYSETWRFPPLPSSTRAVKSAWRQEETKSQILPFYTSYAVYTSICFRSINIQASLSLVKWRYISCLINVRWEHCC